MLDATLRRMALVLSLLVLSLAAPACGDDATPADTTTTTELAISAALDPMPPTTGQHTLTITVLDKDGAPVEGATVTVDPQMPMHGHGSSETAVVAEDGAGVYTAFPVTFQMPGMWQVTITATAGEMTGSAAIDYQVN